MRSNLFTGSFPILSATTFSCAWQLLPSDHSFRLASVHIQVRPCARPFAC